MLESQNIDYKSSCNEDYLQCIYGFENAQGRKIYIGKDYYDIVVSLEDYNMVPFIVISNKKDNIKRVSKSIVKQYIPEKTTPKQTVVFGEEDLF